MKCIFLAQNIRPVPEKHKMFILAYKLVKSHYNRSVSNQTPTPQLSQVSSKNVNVTSVGNIHPIYVMNALVSHTLLQIEPHQNLKQGH